MNDFEIKKLKKLANKFRSYITKLPLRDRPAELKKFPNGSCGTVCLLLAKFLQEKSCGTFNYISAERKGRSHAWLEKNNIKIDITGDQFDDNSQEVIVTPQSVWHTNFKIINQHSADLKTYDQNTQNEIQKIYDKLKKIETDSI